jgi:predicted ATPase
MLVWLDDLQWADAGTVAALRSAPLRAASDHLAGEGAVRIVLEPLPTAAVEQVVAETLGAEPDPEVLLMAGAAGGNPFFLVELLLGLRDEQLVRTREGR